MSFGLGISFGRLCRLEKQRIEAFGGDEFVPVVPVEDKDFKNNCYVKTTTGMKYENIWAIPLSDEENDFSLLMNFYNQFWLKRVCNMSLIQESSCL